MGINPILYQLPAKRFIPVATLKNHATRILSDIDRCRFILFCCN